MQSPLQATEQPLLSVRQISKRLDMSLSFIYQEVSSGRLEHYQLGKVNGRIRVSERQLMNYLESFRKSNQRYSHKRIEIQIPPSVQAVSKALNDLYS